MYRARFTFFAFVSAAIFLALPAVNIALSALSGRLAQEMQTPRKLWSADGAEALYGWLRLRCCNKTPDPKIVIAGSDDFLFLGNFHDRVIDKTTGKFRPSDAELLDWFAPIENLQEVVTQEGGAFALVIAPNKHSVVPWALPDDLPKPATTVTDDMLAIAQQIDLPVLDLREPLRTAAKDRPVYFRTDSHWTTAGATMAVEATMKHLNARHDLQLKPATYQLLPANVAPGGLARLLKMTNLYPDDYEAAQSITLSEGEVTCRALTPFAASEDGPCLDEQARGEITLKQDILSLNLTEAATAPNKLTVLLLCDSFCGLNTRLYEASFHRLYRARWQKLRDTELRDQIKRIKPDIVILQLVERQVMGLPIGIK